MGKAARPVPAHIVPADFGELRLLACNRDPERPLPAEEAFALYERNWLHVDVSRMTPEEAALVRDLTDAYGRGVMLGQEEGSRRAHGRSPSEPSPPIQARKGL